MMRQKHTFTFQYGSIKSETEDPERFAELALHSSMVLLNPVANEYYPHLTFAMRFCPPPFYQ